LPSKKLHQENSFALKWLEVKQDFLKYLESISYNERTIKKIVSQLDKNVSEIKDPFDIVTLFSKVKHSRRHLILGLRKLFRFYELQGVDKDYLNSLRAALPKVHCGIDLKIPSEARIVESLRKLPKAPLKYQALYNLLLDSGLRLVEAVELINSFKDAEAINAFYRCELAMFRGEKQAYYGHLTENTLKLVREVQEKLGDIAASNYFKKYGYVAPKYLRKFAFDKMIELEIPESVADFIEGRMPKRIGAKHYLALARQSSKFYPRYMTYVDMLRNQA
jgi:intergrase/recombinase